MRRLMLKIWIGFISLLAMVLTVPSAYSASSAPVDTGKVLAQLISTHDSVEPGQSFHVALKTTLDNHWHTYWRNPGDSGEPVHIEWILPDGVSASPITWPLPAPIATGPIINYGFEGEPHFPVSFTLSGRAQAGDLLEIKARAYYLVCYDVCIPEDADLSLVLTIGASTEDVLNKAAIDNALLDAPKPNVAAGGIDLSGSNVSITLNSLPNDADLSQAYFFPYEQGYIRHSEPQKLAIGADGISITTAADYRWEEDRPNIIEGVLRYERNGRFEGEVVTLNVGSAVPIGAVPSAHSASALNTAGSGASLSLWTALIGAFIGGLILNVMPCVFPVISMKALNIAKSAHGEIGTIRREAWAYTSGVFATFLALTVLLLIFKAGGTQIGWGFQLQSPVIVGALALLLFAIGLNLLGVFEISGRVQNMGSHLTHSGGRKGAFFTGALAVVVATPCTAPYMAVAVGYALAQSAWITLVIFAALAAGFALPFLLIAYVPGVLKALPKPGPWMTRFKELLSFPMFAAAIWLVWVLSQQAGAGGLIVILSAMLLLSFAIWLRKSSGAVMKLAALAAVLVAIILPLSLRAPTSAAPNEFIAAHETPWSSTAVANAVDNGKMVFVDFTAAWCVTCKINKGLALAHPQVTARFNDDDVVFMVADWTNKNDEIAAELARHGRAGVPLYLVYNPKSEAPMTPKILPQLLSKEIILSALDG